MANKFVKQREDNLNIQIESDHSSTSIEDFAEQLDKSDEVKDFKTKLNIRKRPKELKTVHKNFLITESLNKKYKAFAKEQHMNENELFIEILKQLFEES